MRLHLLLLTAAACLQLTRSQPLSILLPPPTSSCLPHLHLSPHLLLPPPLPSFTYQCNQLTFLALTVNQGGGGGGGVVLSY